MYNSKNSFKHITTLFINGTKIRNESTSKVQTVNKLYKTVLLPKTDFPVYLKTWKRVEADNYLYEHCGFSNLYAWQRQNLPGPDFVLHDGPPYANGVPHMGHAINKILKDITLRNKIISGQRVHYVPGWDCHGLPIELKAVGDYTDNVKNAGPLAIRQKARDYASEAVKGQQKVFQEWGVVADWEESGCYFTNHVSYMNNQLQQFMKLYEKNLIFRDLKPVHWSPSSRTALAESELEYNEKHVSKAIIVRFKLDVLPSVLNSFKNQNVYALTWTTTPWTLIANQALAFSSDLNYCVVKDANGDLNIIAQSRVQDVESKIGQLTPVMTIRGSDLTEARYQHPITKNSSPFLAASHVKDNIGTGLVHTAPAYGPEDFILGTENNLPIISVVDDRGSYTKEAGDKFFELDIFSSGNNAVIEYLGSDMLHLENYVHSYPYDWRTKKPVIIRTSQQWFIDINAIRDKAIESIADIKIYPENNRESFTNTLLAQMKSRSYWCISRQRFWGTPIPILYNKDTKEPIVSRKFVERLCQLIEQHGSDCWWKLSVEELVGEELSKELNVKCDDIMKGEDIMDIWLDSGLSWSAVLPDKKADLYLEGMDQFSGWFQSSLLTSIALQQQSPYRALFVHGFAVDAKDDKMSKSRGNIIDPEKITKGDNILNKNSAYGVDVLRWWVASHGCQHTQIPVTKELLTNCTESLMKIRGILRFLLGLQHPYADTCGIKPEYLYLDKYMLHQLYHYNEQIWKFYNCFQYHNVCKLILHFIANDISSVYCHLTKDRFYCEPVTSPYRVAALDIICQTLIVLLRSIAPILPHLTEEAWIYNHSNITSMPFFHTKFEIPATWKNAEAERCVNIALTIKNTVNKLASKNTWHSTATINATKDDYNELSKLQNEKESTMSELCDILQLSSVTLLEDESLSETEVNVETYKKSLCERCRRHSVLENNRICDRCMKIIYETKTVSVQN